MQYNDYEDTKEGERMTREEMVAKFERLTEQNKVKALEHLEQLIAHQGMPPFEPCSPVTATQYAN